MVIFHISQSCFIVYIRVSTTSPLFCQANPHLKSWNCPSPPPLLGNSPLYIGFLGTPLKIGCFSELPIIFTFFILNPISSFKSNWILSQNFLVWILIYDREKHFLFIKFFAVKYFRFWFVFYEKLHSPPPPWKKSPPLSHKPLSQNWDPVKSPPFENLVGGSTPDFLVLQGMI